MKVISRTLVATIRGRISAVALIVMKVSWAESALGYLSNYWIGDDWDELERKAAKSDLKRAELKGGSDDSDDGRKKKKAAPKANGNGKKGGKR